MNFSTAQISSDMVSSPSAAFAQLQRAPHFWLLLSILTAVPILLYMWYYSTVNFGWLIEHTLAATPELTEEQRTATRSMMTPSTIQRIAVGVVLVFTPLSFAILAVYYATVGRFFGAELGFRDWFAFAIWTSLPKVLLFPLMAFQIADSGGMVAIEDLTMVSLNTLFLHLPNSHAWAGIAAGVDLSLAWSYVLAIIGLRVWTGRSMTTCVIVASFPLLVFYGLWIAKIVIFS